MNAEDDRTPYGKRRANIRISHAINRGHIKPPTSLRCVDCGKKAQEYDHYLGHEPKHYYDIEPVCKSCHAKRSYRRGEWKRLKRPRSGALGPLLKNGKFLSRYAKWLGYKEDHRNQRIALGFCSTCTMRRPKSGFKTCEKCRAYFIIWKRKYRAKLRGCKS